MHTTYTKNFVYIKILGVKENNQKLNFIITKAKMLKKFEPQFYCFKQPILMKVVSMPG